MRISWPNFKKLGLVDLVGLGVFVAILATAVFFFLRRASYVTVTLRISQADMLTYGLPIWYLDSLKPGMVQKDFFGKPTITLLKTYSNPNDINNRVLYLTMSILTIYDRNSKEYSYEGVPVLVGGYQTFTFNGMSLKGVVIRVAEDESKLVVKQYEVSGFLNPKVVSNQDPDSANTVTDGVMIYLANKFVKGLEIKDSNGVVVARVDEVKISPAYRTFIDGGQLVKTLDNEREKVELKVMVETVKVGDSYLYMEDVPIMINNNLNLDFSDFSVPMTITDFKEI